MEPFTDLLRQYRPAETDYEMADAAIVVLAVFDHDLDGQHLLVQEWDYTAPERGWIYALWYIDPWGEPMLVRRYSNTPHGQPPYLSAATLVGCWNAHGHWGGAAI